MIDEILAYPMTSPKQAMVKKKISIARPKVNEVLVEIAGCGLCHTDIGFFEGGVKTKMELPLILGHEISGKVIETGEQFSSLLNKNVIIPAVIPCGDCELCQENMSNLCRKQLMPGNDFHGGFASHILVPGRFLQEVPKDMGEYELADFAVIADAITTPYQSMVDAGVGKDDFVIVIGVGGIGTYGTRA